MRRSAFATGSALFLAVSTVTYAPPSHAASTCSVTNVSSSAPMVSDLQVAIREASPGDELRISGVCVGGFTIDKSLLLVGVPTYKTPEATLDGGGTSRVLRVDGYRGMPLVLSDLGITNGQARYVGGGIWNRAATVSLVDETSVYGNVATYEGGGIYNLQHGSVELGGSASVSRNVASSCGGISNYGRVTMSGDSTVEHNLADARTGDQFNGGKGGGLCNLGTTIVTGSASISDNDAVGGGGGIWNDFDGVVELREFAMIGYNRAPWGGGVASLSRLSLFDDASILHNRARRGGGLYVLGGVDMYGTSTVTQNTARNRGGGMFNDGSVGLHDSSSITDNLAGSLGGGIYNYSGHGVTGIVTVADMAAITNNVPDDCYAC